MHVDNLSCPEFLSLIKCLGLKQHVDIPLHTRGHTLDLVIIRLTDLGSSDFKVVSMDFTFLSTPFKA